MNPARPSSPVGAARPLLMLVLVLSAAVGLQVGRPPAASAAPSPGLSMTASAGPAAVSRVGQAVAYGIVVRNRGAEDLTDLLASDPAAGLSALACSPVGQGGTLGAGASTTCRATRTTVVGDLRASAVTDTFRATAKAGARR